MGYVGHTVDAFVNNVEQSNAGTYADKQYAFYKHRINTDGSGYISLRISNDKQFDGDTFGFMAMFLNDAGEAIAARDFRWGIGPRKGRDETVPIVVSPEVVSLIRSYSILWYRVDTVPDLGELGIALAVIAIAAAVGIPFAPPSAFIGI
jgi:hypothetical protein